MTKWNTLTESERVHFVKLGYINYGYGDKVKKYGYVAGKVNDPKTGEQAYIVTPNDPKSKNFDPKKVKNVTVLYRGSTGANKLLQKNQTGHDARRDWVQNDIPAAVGIFNNVSAANLQKFSQTTSAGFPLSSYAIALQTVDQGTPQMHASAQTLHQVLKHYPQALVDVYGHSLGSMNGQYALAHTSQAEAKRIRAAYLYEGPNVYSLLNPKEKKRADQLKNRIFNYVDPKDKIPMTGLDYHKWQKSVGTVIRIDSNKVASTGLDALTEQHMFGGYQFDKNGNLNIVSQNGKKITIKSAGSQTATLVKSEKIGLQSSSIEAAVSALQGSKKPLESIRKINDQLYPEMQKTFQKLTREACDLPYITASDVADVVARHHLEPKEHIDLDKVTAVDKLVDDNLAKTEALIKGLKNAADHIEQDDQTWSAKFTAD